jgi:hypothetical protein
MCSFGIGGRDRGRCFTLHYPTDPGSRGAPPQVEGHGPPRKHRMSVGLDTFGCAGHKQFAEAMILRDMGVVRMDRFHGALMFREVCLCRVTNLDFYRDDGLLRKQNPDVQASRVPLVSFLDGILTSDLRAYR